MKLLIFTATLNEAGNIGTWYSNVREKYPETDLLVIDDSSQDGTLDILNSLSESDKKLKIIKRQKKLGLGSAHTLAFHYALENDYQLLITMDADLSHNPSEISKLLEIIPKCDYVVGSRFKDGTLDYRFFRKNIAKLANSLCRLLIPTGLSEYTTSFRCFNKKALDTLVKNKKWNENYSFFIEVTNFLYCMGLHLEEVPINFKKRFSGKSKIPRTQILKSAITLIRLWIHRKKAMIKARP